LRASVADDIFNGLIISSDSLREPMGKEVLSLGMPRVLPPDGEGSDWEIWYQYRDESIPTDVLQLSTGRIAFASSKDGLRDWKLHEDSPVMGPNKEQGDWFYFDSDHVGVGDVIRPGSVTTTDKFASSSGLYLMYIFGGNGESLTLPGPPERKVKGSKIEVGIAVSQDGAHWSRIEGPSAYGSVLEVGKRIEDFDALFVGWPSVIPPPSESPSGAYTMYYSTMDPASKKYSIGMATSADGLLKWCKVRKPGGSGSVFAGSEEPGAFDSRGASRRHVLRQADGSLRMYYEAVSQEGRHSIGMAVSRDGYNWERSGEQPIFAANDDAAAWDGGGVGSPHLVFLPEQQRWRMYYVGYPLGKDGSDSNYELGANGIGVVESDDAEGYIFRRR